MVWTLRSMFSEVDVILGVGMHRSLALEAIYAYADRSKLGDDHFLSLQNTAMEAIVTPESMLRWISCS